MVFDGQLTFSKSEYEKQFNSTVTIEPICMSETEMTQHAVAQAEVIYIWIKKARPQWYLLAHLARRAIYQCIRRASSVKT